MPRQTIPLLALTLCDAPKVRFSDRYLDLRDGDLAEIAVRGLGDDIGDEQLRAVSGSIR